MTTMQLTADDEQFVSNQYGMQQMQIKDSFRCSFWGAHFKIQL